MPENLVEAKRPYGKGRYKRLDRCIRIYMEIPRHIPEEKVMDFLEEIVSARISEIGINPDTVCVRKHTPRYGEQK